jgi:hypothetical protein
METRLSLVVVTVGSWMKLVVVLIVVNHWITINVSNTDGKATLSTDTKGVPKLCF